MDPLDYTARVTVLESVLMQELDGEAVLLHLDSGKYFGLDLVGTRMWELLESSQTIQLAFDQLLEEFDVESDQLRADLERMIVELSEQMLIQVRPVD